MRLDHIAYRVKSRKATVNQLSKVFGYRAVADFQPYGDDSVMCSAMVPPERPKQVEGTAGLPFFYTMFMQNKPIDYHFAPEIFVSEGKPDSVVGKWVSERSGIGGIHHVAYNVNNVAKVMQEWQTKGIRFLSEEPLECEGVIQVFTQPLDWLGGVIVELISRTPEKGFCQDNVRALMDSTR